MCILICTSFGEIPVKQNEKIYVVKEVTKGLLMKLRRIFYQSFKEMRSFASHADNIGITGKCSLSCIHLSFLLLKP